jgi:hypothetical protein
MQQQLQLQQMQQQTNVADALNDQLAQEVPSSSYVDPNQQRMMVPMNNSQMMPQTEGKIPEYLKDPLAVFVFVILFTYPAIRDSLAKYIPQLAGEGGKPTTASVLIVGLLVAVAFALYKKFFDLGKKL